MGLLKAILIFWDFIWFATKNAFNRKMFSYLISKTICNARTTNTVFSRVSPYSTVCEILGTYSFINLTHFLQHVNKVEVFFLPILRKMSVSTIREKGSFLTFSYIPTYYWSVTWNYFWTLVITIYFRSFKFYILIHTIMMLLLSNITLNDRFSLIEN